MPREDTQFKPGVSGNYAGRGKLNPELAKLKSLTKDEVARVIGKYTRMSTEEIKEASASNQIPIMDRIICSILLEAVLEGDYSRFNFLLDRTVGKVKEEVEVSQPKPFIIQRPNGSQTILGSKLETGEEIE